MTGLLCVVSYSLTRCRKSLTIPLSIFPTKFPVSLVTWNFQSPLSFQLCVIRHGQFSSSRPCHFISHPSYVLHRLFHSSQAVFLIEAFLSSSQSLTYLSFALSSSKRGQFSNSRPCYVVLFHMSSDMFPRFSTWPDFWPDFPPGDQFLSSST